MFIDNWDKLRKLCLLYLSKLSHLKMKKVAFLSKEGFSENPFLLKEILVYIISKIDTQSCR